MAFISSVVDQHAEEAVTLFLLREKAVCSPHYSLRDLVKLDYRLDANLDGLRLAGDEGWKLCEQLMEQEGAAGIFTAAVVALSAGKETQFQSAMSAVTREPKLTSGLVRGLGWLSFAQAEGSLMRFLAADASSVQSVGISAAAIHRRCPVPALLSALRQPDAALQARALRAAGEQGCWELLPAASSFLRSDSEAVRAAAAWSVTLLSGSAEAIVTLKSVAESSSPLRRSALRLAMRMAEPSQARDWHRQISDGSHDKRLAIESAGAMGDPAIVPWLIAEMKEARLARAAGEALTTITGVDLISNRLEGKRAETFEVGPNERPEDDNVEMDEDENLPWPDATLIQEWWQKNEGRFPTGIRCILGKPITPEWLHQVLRIGRQRHREAAALELAASQPSQPLFNVAVPGYRQLAMLG